MKTRRFCITHSFLHIFLELRDLKHFCGNFKVANLFVCLFVCFCHNANIFVFGLPQFPWVRTKRRGHPLAGMSLAPLAYEMLIV